MSHIKEDKAGTEDRVFKSYFTYGSKVSLNR